MRHKHTTKPLQQDQVYFLRNLRVPKPTSIWKNVQIKQSLYKCNPESRNGWNALGNSGKQESRIYTASSNLNISILAHSLSGNVGIIFLHSDTKDINVVRQYSIKYFLKNQTNKTGRCISICEHSDRQEINTRAEMWHRHTFDGFYTCTHFLYDEEKLTKAFHFGELPWPWT